MTPAEGGYDVGYKNASGRKEVYGQGIPGEGTHEPEYFDSQFDSHRVGIGRAFRIPAHEVAPIEMAGLPNSHIVN
jgi:hypothetical protein